MEKVRVNKKITDKGEEIVYMNGFIAYKYLGFNCNGITLEHCRKQTREHFLYVAKLRKYKNSKSYKLLREKKKRELEEKKMERINRHREWIRGGLVILNELKKVK